MALTGKKRNLYPDKKENIDLLHTLKNFLATEKFSVKYAKTVTSETIHLLFIIDATGSMIKEKQIAFVKGLIMETIKQYPEKKTKMGLISMSNGTAKILCGFEQNKNILTEAIDKIKAGGKTNLLEGFRLANNMLSLQTQKKYTQLFIITDGQINMGTSAHPLNDAVLYYHQALNEIRNKWVMDTEIGFVKLGLAKKLAAAIKAKYFHLQTYFQER